jgi:hypothetical protein
MPLAHSFNEGQIEWFRAGSALNLVRRWLVVPLVVSHFRLRWQMAKQLREP